MGVSSCALWWRKIRGPERPEESQWAGEPLNRRALRGVGGHAECGLGSGGGRG